MENGKRGCPQILVMDRASVILPEMLAADHAKRCPPRKLGDGPRKCGSPRAVVVGVVVIVVVVVVVVVVVLVAVEVAIVVVLIVVVVVV